MNLEISGRAVSARRGGPLTGAVLRDDSLGLIGVADCPDAGPLAAAATQLAIDLLTSHVARNADLIDRFRRHPNDELRGRLVRVLEEGFGRAGREVYALGRRRRARVVVALDVALIVGEDAFVGHAGDGAVFLSRRGLLHRLTAAAVGAGGGALTLIVPPAAGGGGAAGVELLLDDEDSPAGGLGLEPRAPVEVLSIELQGDDGLLIAGGALCDAMSDDALRDEVGDKAPEALTAHLAERAAVAGGRRSALGAAARAAAPSRPSQLRPEDEARARLAVLAQMPLFTHCTEPELRAVAGATRPRTVRRGAALLTQGAPGDGIYLLVAGDVEILKDGNEIARIGPGASFGEMSMLDEPLASATVRAATDVETLVISREAFFRLLKTEPTFAVKILWNMLLQLSANLRKTSARLADVTGNLPRSY